ncbi:MAG TPA: phosphate signaling complex protein PhoU [Candidatus Paceibacterota bacterium]|nr:phosphate signaling complex protein PhoU [Verrucomicrobiota bacterium]HOX03474.1 phosphate signaling complex protein PhoU [Verrucomicrobiota bacterium]HRZ46331.1 phosphate signaling complex protein PhoU [Candidatus Paceibacterota bacterium]HRZ91709.1 phosphate signaling complex protein PhoU [Candidatus Paceibacterota bacterium]
MQRHFDQDLAQLREKLLTMASLAENDVVDAVKALTDRNDDLALEVRSRDDVLDRFEIELDELCINLLALKAPIASDLRLVTVAMKVTQNLERVGDEADKIAKRALELNRVDPIKPLLDIPRMAGLAEQMLRDALDSFVKGDTARARATIERDAEVDALNKQVHRELVSYMIEDSSTITRCLHLMVVAKSLERIADHATNIAEEVVFLYEGHDIRHGPKSPAAKSASPMAGS